MNALIYAHKNEIVWRVIKAVDVRQERRYGDRRRLSVCLSVCMYVFPYDIEKECN